MIKCALCKKPIVFLKKVKSINVYECKHCKICILPKNSPFLKSNIYSFDGYRLRENFFKKRFTYISETISKYKREGNVLDVGAGFGLLAAILSKNKKFKVELVEPSITPYYSKNLKIYNTTLNKFVEIKKKKYDIVLLMDVLEHFKSPIEALTKVRKILNKNGIIVINTPNYKSLMANIVHNWSWWMPEDHKVLFSVKSLRKALKLTGYDTYYVETYESLSEFKSNLDGNYMHIKFAPFRKLIKAMNYLFFFPCYILIRHVFWYFGYGGLIFLIAKKN